MQELINEWKRLIKAGYYLSARLLLRSMIFKQDIFISDGNNEAYASGLADFLMNRRDWINERWGFTGLVRFYLKLKTNGGAL